MIGDVLDELGTHVQTVLPQKIALVAGLKSVSLDTDFSYYDWWQVQSEKFVVNFPAFSLAWDPKGTRTGQRDGTNGRKAWHRITATYTVRSADSAYIRRHMLYVAEAILLWLDELPSASRAPGTGRTVVGLDRADGNEVEISHDLEAVQQGALIWSLDAEFTVLAKDTGLPPRTTT